MRLLLAALRRGNAPDGLLGGLDDDVIASQREVFERVTGLVSSELQAAEVAALRPQVYRRLAQASPEPLLLKVHDRFESAAVGPQAFPPGQARALVYLVRDPRDVCVSFAHHLGLPVEETLQRMLRESLHLNGGELPQSDQFEQWLGRWDRHVSGWLDQRCADVLMVRYEDLLCDTVAVLARVIERIGIPATTHDLEQAVARCRFDRLVETEAREGFAERSGPSLRFFRSGRSGSWRDVLTAEQAARIEAEFGVVMRRLGYLGAAVDRP
jgi:hypothetical protein